MRRARRGALVAREAQRFAARARNRRMGRAAEWLVCVRDGADLSCHATTEAIEQLGSARFAALRTARELHTSAANHADPIVATSFAADRLDP